VSGEGAWVEVAAATKFPRLADPLFFFLEPKFRGGSRAYHVGSSGIISQERITSGCFHASMASQTCLACISFSSHSSNPVLRLFKAALCVWPWPPALLPFYPFCNIYSPYRHHHHPPSSMPDRERPTSSPTSSHPPSPPPPSPR